MVGLVDDVLADRAFVDDRQRSAAELATLADLASDAPHFVADALAAAALARSHGVPRSPSATRCGPSAGRPPHLGRRRVGGVTWVDDSKATNPHAALASLRAYDPVVWVAGGLAKGPASTTWCRRCAPAARRGAAGARRPRGGRRPAATRARCAVIEVGSGEDGPDPWTSWSRVPRRWPSGRHGAPGPGVCLDGHVHRLRRARRRLRRGGASPVVSRPVRAGQEQAGPVSRRETR